MLKNTSLDKICVTKNNIFIRELQLITVLLLTCDSYTSGRTCFISLKLCVEFLIFSSVSFSLNFIYFCSAKNIGFLTLKRHIFFQNKNDGEAICSFAPRPLIFELQQEV